MSKVLIALVAIGAAVVFAIQQYRQSTTRDAIQSLRQQVAELDSLRADNDRLVKVIADAQSTAPASSDETAELLRLRAEVTRLRNENSAAASPKPVRGGGQFTFTNQAQYAWPSEADKQALVTIDQYSGQPLDPPEHPLLRPVYELAKNGDLEGLKKGLDEHPEFLNLPVGSAGSTILHTAAYNGQPQAVEELLRRKAYINAQNKAGHTPLYDSAVSGHSDTALLLLRAGADVSIADNNGLTPLQAATRAGRSETADLLRQYGAKE